MPPLLLLLLLVSSLFVAEAYFRPSLLVRRQQAVRCKDDESEVTDLPPPATPDSPIALDSPIAPVSPIAPASPIPTSKAMYFSDSSNLGNRADEDFGFDLGRFIGFNSLAIIIALGANFLGITTALISNTNPSYFRSLGVDQLYSINGFRRASNTEDKYEFIFPQDWVIDQSIYMNKVRARELPQAMRTTARAGGIKPDIAYGPPGSNGKENLSVVKSSVMPGFSLEMLGTPQTAAERLLTEVIAPKASGKTYELLNSYSDVRSGLDAYTFEYTVKKDPYFHQHAISVIVARGTELYTYTATAPEVEWATVQKDLVESAKSFELGADSMIPRGFY